jgi:hypothetical protein
MDVVVRVALVMNYTSAAAAGLHGGEAAGSEPWLPIV